MKDQSDLLHQAANLYWSTESTDEVVKLLDPMLRACSIPALDYVIGCLRVDGRLAEARDYAEVVLRSANTSDDYARLLLMCEKQVFADLGFDQASIYRRAMLALANQGNPVVQADVALNFLRGAPGFEKSDDQFRYWILRSIEGSNEIDPVCYYVEFLLERGEFIDPSLKERLHAAAAESPDWRELQVLCSDVEKRSVGLGP